MLHKCYWCGHVFIEPEILVERENMDGENWETRRVAVCPWCKGDEFDTIDEEDEP